MDDTKFGISMGVAMAAFIVAIPFLLLFLVAAS
jgi:hypothetical protein